MKHKPGKADATNGITETAVPTHTTNSVKYLPLALCFILGLWYWYVYSNTEGMYQHDEAGHMLDMLTFWDHPLDTLTSIWSRGGYKILYAIPGLGGEKAIVFLNVLLSCGTAYLVYAVSREMKLKSAWLGIIFFGLQPYIINLSFRCYAELPTMFFSILLVYLYIKQKYLWAAVTVSFLFSLRQEMAVFALLLGVIFIMKRKWLPFIVMAWAPIALGLVGWYKTGNPMFIVDTLVQGGFADTYQRNGFFYLWLMLPDILGVVIVLFFIAGYLSFFTGVKEERKVKFRKYHSVFILFTVYFLMHCLFTSKAFGFGRSGGVGRFLIVISPCVAVIALIGFNFFSEAKEKIKTRLAVAAISLALLFVFFAMMDSILPIVYNGFFVVNKVQENIFCMILAAIIIFLLIVLKPKATSVYASFAGGLVLIYALLTVRPLPLTVEDETIKAASDWFWSSAYTNRPLHSSHSLFNYYAMKSGNNYKSIKVFDSASLVNAKKGEIFILENHYALRNVSDSLLQRSNLGVLQQFNIPGSQFAAMVLEKQ